MVRRRFVFEVDVQYELEDFKWDWGTDPETEVPDEVALRRFNAITPNDALDVLLMGNPKDNLVFARVEEYES